MGVNNYIGIAQQVAGSTPENKPSVDHAAQVNLGMDFAARQAERAKTPTEEVKIPTLGATPLAN